jgi:hypothetical protein
MHHRADTVDAFPCVLGFSIPDPPVQSLDLGHDHRLRGRARRITRRQSIANLFEMLKSHRDVEPVENRRFQDTSIGENTPESRTNRRSPSSRLLMKVESLPRAHDRQRVFLLLRMFAALGNIKPLVEVAGDELFHELGYMAEITEFLKHSAWSKDVPAENRFWALDGLVFAQFKKGDEAGIDEMLNEMHHLVERGGLSAKEQLALSMKQMIFAAHKGDAATAQRAMEDTVVALQDKPVHLRIARYNYAHAMFELGMFKDCVDGCDNLIAEYYQILGLTASDVMGHNPDEIRPLLKEGPNHTDDLKHLADTLDMRAKANNRLGSQSGFARVHAMKLYSMAQDLDSFIRVGQDLVDEFVRRHDYVGARDVIEKNLRPTVLQSRMASHIIPVRSQYAVILAYRGEFRQAEAELNRLSAYETGLDERGRAELQRQRACVADMKLNPPPPQWKLPLPGEKVGRNAPCPCGSGKKYKNCHGRTQPRQPLLDSAASPQELMRRLEKHSGSREAMLVRTSVMLSTSGQPTDVTFYSRQPILDVKMDGGIGAAAMYGAADAKLLELLRHMQSSDGTTASIVEICTINPMPKGGLSQTDPDAVDLSEAEEKVGPNGETLREMIRDTYHCKNRADEDRFLRRFIAS